MVIIGTNETMNNYKRLFHILSEVLQYMAMGLFALLFFALLSPRLPTKNIFTAYIVPTGSMQPTILPGSIAFIRPTNSVHTGDIIAFQSPNDNIRTILHRITQEKDGGFVTKGDNNSSADDWIVTSQLIKGKMVFSIPWIGSVASFIRTKLGFFLIVFVPGAFLLAKQLMDLGNAVHAKLYPVVLFGACLFVTVSLTNVANAAFSDTARVKGISFTAKKAETPPPPSCHGGADINIQGKFPSLIQIKLNGNTLLLITLPFPQRSHVSYSVLYDHEGVEQAVLGNFETMPFLPIIKPIFLGTCSGGSCIPHHFTTCPKVEVIIQ
jgi:signal peptidase I